MKKWLVFVLAAMMMFSAVAYAAAPSKTTSDVTQVLGYESSTSVTPEADFAVFVTQDKEEVSQELTKIYDYVATQQQTPITYFDETVQEDIAEKLPAGSDLGTLEMNEFITIGEQNYKDTYGDVAVQFQFVTQYRVGQKLVALIGIYTGDVDVNGNYIVEWVALDAEAQANGSVKILFPADILARMADAPALALAVLDEPMEG